MGVLDEGEDIEHELPLAQEAALAGDDLSRGPALLVVDIDQLCHACSVP